ncbi:uncharacterized protein LOC121945893 [Plectropomus leopardus]|uniref:uncharacterized protein LOC121945893 n=1 Tax=Plectropomus leopardus TaxID=160734 RepID=UPI001C4CB281|nr:uncharacterized protein LOC121945893 [Plectropomus leopardus]
MAALRVFLTLAICLLLGHQTFARNDAPCQHSKFNNGFNTFVKRHIRSGTPNNVNQNEWYDYIKNNGGCDRPTQSFLPTRDLERVKAVCTNKGGKVYKDNLCISREPFTFVTVRSELGTCGIRSVRLENKHLILACEELSNQCLPVHFEGNSENAVPSNNARGCQDPRISDDAPSNRLTTWLGLLSVLLLIIYGYQN